MKSFKKLKEEIEIFIENLEVLLDRKLMKDIKESLSTLEEENLISFETFLQKYLNFFNFWWF